MPPSNVRGRLSEHSPMSASSLLGQQALQFLPRCATLARYGGGDDMRLGEALLSLPLSVAALPPPLQDTVEAAVDIALEGAPAAAAAGAFAAEQQPAGWDRSACTWDVALALTTDPVGGADDTWANLYWHGWLFGDIIESGAEPDAVQRFPLCGIWDPSPGITAFDSGDALGDVGLGDDVRAAGVTCLRAADQHIHKLDAYAGGDRDGTIALCMEQGFTREAAEASVLAAERECGQYHVGSDTARVALRLDAPGGAVCWAVCVDLAVPATPRAQVTLLVALSGDDAAALWARRWAPAEGDAALAEEARAELLSGLGGAGLAAVVWQRVEAALRA